MLRHIDRRTFVPHSSSCYNATAEQITKKVSEFCYNISTQLYQTRTAQITPENGTKFSDLELAALANIITHELIYYHQLGDAELADEDLCRGASVQLTQTVPTSPNQPVHKKIGDLCMKMGIASEQYLLGPAGCITSPVVSQQRHCLGLITHSILVCLGGCSFKGGPMTSSISINEILAELAGIAKASWSRVALLKKINRNAFDESTKPDKTIRILPNESVFGNYNGE